MALLTSTHRIPRSLPAKPLPTGSRIARPEVVYGVFANVMADRRANQARRDVIVSSWKVCHLLRRPARPLAATRTLSYTLRSNFHERWISRADIKRNQNRADRGAWRPTVTRWTPTSGIKTRFSLKLHKNFI